MPVWQLYASVVAAFCARVVVTLIGCVSLVTYCASVAVLRQRGSHLLLLCIGHLHWLCLVSHLLCMCVAVPRQRGFCACVLVSFIGCVLLVPFCASVTVLRQRGSHLFWLCFGHLHWLCLVSHFLVCGSSAPAW